MSWRFMPRVGPFLHVPDERERGSWLPLVKALAWVIGVPLLLIVLIVATSR